MVQHLDLFLFALLYQLIKDNALLSTALEDILLKEMDIVEHAHYIACPMLREEIVFQKVHVLEMLESTKMVYVNYAPLVMS